MKIVKKLAFLLHHVDLINHWNNIFQAYDKNKYSVILTDDTISLIPYLKEKNIKYVFLNEIKDKKIKYLYMISNHIGGLEKNNKYLIQNIAIYNIRYLYALGKSKWNFSEWNNLYNMILCMGPYQVSKLKFCKKTLLKEIGYSRYDDYFNKQLNKNNILRSLNCNPTKKTIIWLPTWKELCSIESYCDSISNLTKDYNVVVKPHPLTYSFEKEKIDLLNKYNFTKILLNNFNTLHLYVAADWVFCDYGGPPFGAIYTDKNLLLLNLENQYKSSNLENDSPDIVIRQDIININQDQKNNISDLLKNSNIWNDQKIKRELLRKKYFSQNYGQSTDSFKKILNNLNKHFPFIKLNLLKYQMKSLFNK